MACSPPASRISRRRSCRAYGDHLLLVKARNGEPVRYFTGAGWNRSGQFSDRASWETYVKAFAAQVAHPLTIAVQARAVSARP